MLILKNLKISVNVGPGSHNDAFLSELKLLKATVTFSKYWPFFQIGISKNGESIRLVKRSCFYDFISFIVSFLGYRFSFLNKRNIHVYKLYQLYDKLSSYYLSDCDLFIGWSQTSLSCLKSIKSKKCIRVLEHPMNHVLTWMNMMNDEYDLFSDDKVFKNSLFTTDMINRMLAEYKEVDYINVLSSFSRKTFLDNGISSEKILVTPLGVDTELFRPLSNQGPNFEKFKILFVGRLELLKGCHYLLKAMNELALPDVELILVGKIFPELETILEMYKGSYTYLGTKSNTELIALYQQCDVFILPSIQESFGLVLLEAMACGKPVIATDHTGAVDFVNNYENGFVVPIRSSEHLSRKIQYLYENREHCFKMGLNARKLIEEEYNKHSYGVRLRDNINYIISKN